MKSRNIAWHHQRQTETISNQPVHLREIYISRSSELNPPFPWRRRRLLRPHPSSTSDPSRTPSLSRTKRRRQWHHSPCFRICPGSPRAREYKAERYRIRNLSSTTTRRCLIPTPRERHRKETELCSRHTHNLRGAQLWSFTRRSCWHHAWIHRWRRPDLLHLPPPRPRIQRPCSREGDYYSPSRP